MMVVSSSHHHRRHHQNQNFVPLEDVVVSRITVDGARSGGGDGDGGGGGESIKDKNGVIYLKHEIHQQEEYRV